MSSREDASAVHPIRRLTELFHRNGYVRDQNSLRQEEGWRVYKKGKEIRFILFSRVELAEVRRLLRSSGFKAGRAFRKNATQWCQPVYGKSQATRLLELVMGGQGHNRGGPGAD